MGGGSSCLFKYPSSVALHAILCARKFCNILTLFINFLEPVHSTSLSLVTFNTIEG